MPVKILMPQKVILSTVKRSGDFTMNYLPVQVTA